MKQEKLILTVCCGIFLLLGLITAALGPVLSDLAQNAGVTLASVGAVFSGLFLGALVSQLITGPIGDRIGQKWVLLVGMVLMAAGTFGMSFSRSLPLTIALAFLAGLGHGGVDLGGNVLIAVVFNGRSVSAVNLLNVFFGLGAFIGPAAVSFSLKQWQTGLPALWGCALLLLVAAPFIVRMRVKPALERSRETSQKPSRLSSSVYRSALLWILGLLILLYVGTENGLGGWITTYLNLTTAMAVESAALATAGFWLALTAGRLISAGLGLRMASHNLLLVSLIGAGTGGALLVLAVGNPGLSIAGVLLTGLSFGSIYPTVMAVITAHFQQEPVKAVSVVAAMGSIGGTLLPWLHGIALNQVSQSATPWLAFTGAVLMLALLLVARAQLTGRSLEVHPVVVD